MVFAPGIRISAASCRAYWPNGQRKGGFVRRSGSVYRRSGASHPANPAPQAKDGAPSGDFRGARPSKGSGNRLSKLRKRSIPYESWKVDSRVTQVGVAERALPSSSNRHPRGGSPARPRLERFRASDPSSRGRLSVEGGGLPRAPGRGRPRRKRDRRQVGRTLLPGPDESDGHPPPRLRRQPGGDAPGREHIARGRVQRVHVRPARLRKERRRGHVRRTRAGRSPGRRRLCLVAPRCRRGAPRCVRLLDGRSDTDPGGRPGTEDQGPRRRLGLVRGAKLAAAEREGLVPPSTGPLQRPLAEARGEAERDRPRRHSSGRRDRTTQPATRAPRARRS